MTHRVSYRVYYEDTDSLAVVYYANYFKFFERGRSEFLSANGHGVAELNAAGVLVVVHSVNAQFRKSARLGEMLDVVTGFEVRSAFRGRFHQRIERDGELIVEATVDVACITAEQTLIELPEPLRALADR